MAEGPGYERGEYGARSSQGRGTVINLSPGQELKDLPIKLTPQATVSGKILDDAGEPVSHAPVLVMGVRYHRGRRQMVVLGSAPTDDTGRYRIDNLRPGRHYLLVVPPAEAGCTLAYYPGVNEISQATRLNAAAGAELQGVDLRLRREPAFRVAGIVVAASGAPARNCYITLVPRDLLGHPGFGGTWVRADGTFELRNIVPGSYHIRASILSGEHETTQIPLVVGDRDVEGVSILFPPCKSLPGTLTVAAGEQAKFDRVRVRLDRLDMLPGGSPVLRLDGDNSFLIPGACATEYRISAYDLPAAAYVSSVKSGERQFEGRDVDFAGGVPARIEVAVGLAGSSVAGTVSYNDAPFADAVVALVPQEPGRVQSGYARATRSQDDGTFSITGIRPGRYALFAWEEVDTDAWEDPGFLGEFKDQAVTITLDPRATESVKLKLIPAAH